MDGVRCHGHEAPAIKCYPVRGVFGGSVDFEGHCCDVLEIYDIDTDSWIRGKDLPIAGETWNTDVRTERI